MDIALFHNLPPGGAKRTVYEQVKYLSRYHAIHLYRLSCTDETYLSLSPFVKSVHTYNFTLSSHRLIADFQKFVVLPLIHLRMARQISADVVLAHADTFTQAPYLLRFLRIPSLYFCQEMLRIAYEPELAFSAPVGFLKTHYELLTRHIKKIIDRTNAQSATAILTNSDFTGANVRRQFRRSTVTCHLGVDPTIFYPVKTPRKNLLLFVDQKDSISGYPLVQEILSLLPPARRPQLEVLEFKNGRPTAGPANLAVHYSQALATLCTSFNEPFGLSPLESMACATPVLAVDQGGFKETVISGVTGWLLPRQASKFAEKIRLLQDHPELGSKMGSAGRKHVLKNFTWDQHSRLVNTTLCRLASL